jgi:hypothetical protein
MPVWLQNEGAWIAIGISLLFVVAGWVMHRVFLRILKNPVHPPASPPNLTEKPNAENPK